MANNSERATAGHHDLFEAPVIPGTIEDAIQLLSPRPSTAAVVALFDGRASYEAIKKWRQQRHNAPQWAIELLASKIQDRANHLALGARRTAAIIPGPGRATSAANILAWNARNKEKAGNKPALPE